MEAAKEVKVNDGQCAKCLVSAACESCFLAEKFKRVTRMVLRDRMMWSRLVGGAL